MLNRVRAVIAVATLVVAFGAPAALASRPAPPPKPAALLIGDSLTVEAGPMWKLILGHRGVVPEQHSFGGTAPCDWFGDIESTVATLRPAVVVFSFVGTTLTPCTRGSHGEPLLPDALAARYHADAERATELAGRFGATVVWTTGPVPATPLPGYWQIRAAFEDVARTHSRTRYVDGDELIAPHGMYAETQPCLFFEPCEAAGQNRVRAPDGIHFCPLSVPSPVEQIDGRCRVYSSGATRYGIVLANPVLRALGWL